MSRDAVTEDWFFRSDTGRGVQQQAAYFRALGKVLLEYVWNSLDNPDEGAERTRCDVTFVDWQNKKKRTIVIVDNGCGMTKTEVRDQFLTLFRENERRRNKKWARGQYGTGKVAFLGIADTLTLSTVKDGKKTTIRIHKSTFKPGTERPRVDALETEVKTNEPNGTRITISELQDRKHGTDQAKELLRSELLGPFLLRCRHSRQNRILSSDA